MRPTRCRAGKGVPCFNPRTPGGVRLHVLSATPPKKSFNPRTPGGVRPRQTRTSLRRLSCFNPRTPGGVRHCGGMRKRSEWSFNPRTPGGVRLYYPVLLQVFFLVSIHAPRAGCDQLLAMTAKRKNSFNPRTPGGVRRLVDRLDQCVSLCFNPRTPGGVRRGTRKTTNVMWRFNPRTPGGVRRNI